MIVALDHVAIAVDDLPASIRRLVEDFGVACAGQEDVPSELTSTAFFPLPGTRIELIHPMNGAGPVQKSLDTRGPGLHHLCFRTTDIVADMERLRARGYRFLAEEPKPGAHGTLVAFIHPRSTGGVLVELAQHPEGG